jgi:hypothetical protein
MEGIGRGWGSRGSPQPFPGFSGLMGGPQAHMEPAWEINSEHMPNFLYRIDFLSYSLPQRSARFHVSCAS